MNRRGFLAAMFAAASAPAVVRAESLMKLAVPSKKIILPPALAALGADFDGDTDFTVEAWITRGVGLRKWETVMAVQAAGVLTAYRNGVLDTNSEAVNRDLNAISMAIKSSQQSESIQGLSVEEIRITKGVARPIESMAQREIESKRSCSFIPFSFI